MQILLLEPREVWIEGDNSELQSVRAKLLDVELVARGFSHYVDTDFDAPPNCVKLNALRVEPGQTPLLVSVSDDVLCFRGDADDMNRLASFFRFSPSSKAGAHSHHEYFEGNPYIDSDSIPLVIGVTSAG